MRRPAVRLTLVMRLTLVYGALFAATAIAVVVVSYTLLRLSFHEVPQPGEAARDFGLGPPPAQTGPPAPGTPLGEYLAATRDRIEDDSLTTLATRSAVVLAVAIPLTTVAAWWLARRAVRPVRQITAHAREISDANLHERIALTGPRDELADLADTFDRMLERLEQAFAAQRSFAANASHEIRTPLATMAAEADLALVRPDATEAERRLATAMAAGVRRCDDLLGGLLVIARAESGTSRQDPVDLGDVAGEAVAELTGLANTTGVRLDLTLEDAWVTGDRVLLHALVTNLVRNAIAYNDDRAEVEVRVDADATHARLSVSNTGALLSEEDIARLLQPFSRLPGHSRPGTGIGTAVVTAVAEVHAGEVLARPRGDGGLNVLVRIPARPDPRPTPRSGPACVADTQSRT